jgi:hypothetical protein
MAPRGVDVNYHTLSDFRTAHPAWLKQQVVRPIAALRAEGLASLEVLGKDPYVAQPGDSPEVATWHQRMGSAEAQEKSKQRGKCEWSNAQCRNRGPQQFPVRGLQKVKAVVLWYVLVHNLFR